MEKLMYVMLIEKSKTYNKLTKKAVTEHVENIRKLDDEGKLEICGVFKGYPGMAGMYILKTDSREDSGQELYLEKDEETLQCGKSCSPKSIPSQFAASVCKNLLSSRKGYCTFG